jgi:hypothetical protein
MKKVLETIKKLFFRNLVSYCKTISYNKKIRGKDESQ